MYWKFSAVALLLLAACADDPPVTDPGETAEAPLYAITTSVFSASESATYVNLLDSLDATSVRLADAREFAGFAPVATHAGKVFVSSGESPKVTRFTISDAGTWIDEQSISFANQLSFGGVSSAFVDADTAYAPVDVLGRILWDPTAMQIVDTRPAPANVPLERDGRLANLGYDHPLRGTRLYQPVYWADAAYQTYSAESQVIVYDTTTDEVASVVDTQCPHLHIASRDPADNIYLSNGSLSGTMPLFDEAAPRNCVVRLNAGTDTIDDSFTFAFADVAGGREGAGFRILDDKTAFFAVFHHENVTITPESDPTAINYSENWRLWRMDLETRAAVQIQGLPSFAGQYLTFRIDGRTFISFPAADYATTTTFELLPDGRVDRRFTVDGWSFDMFRIR